jgi:uncharacterized protein YbbK (DUF523 family)
MSIMTGTERPRVGVSSCLLGSLVRFDGGHKRFGFPADELGPYVDWVPYCPEVEIGLGQRSASRSAKAESWSSCSDTSAEAGATTRRSTP